MISIRPNRYLEFLAVEPNIRVRVFNPFWIRLGRPWFWLLEILFSFRRLNHRMHNKLLVVDDDWAMVGGGNIGDAYLGLPAQHQFADPDVCRARYLVPIWLAGFLVTGVDAGAISAIAWLVRHSRADSYCQ